MAWIHQGWFDYLAPQLYWRDNSPQSFSALLRWWRNPGVNPAACRFIPASASKSSPVAHGRPPRSRTTALAGKIHRPAFGRRLHLWDFSPLMKNAQGIRSIIASSRGASPSKHSSRRAQRTKRERRRRREESSGRGNSPAAQKQNARPAHRVAHRTGGKDCPLVSLRRISRPYRERWITANGALTSNQRPVIDLRPAKPPIVLHRTGVAFESRAQKGKSGKIGKNYSRNSIPSCSRSRAFSRSHAAFTSSAVSVRSEDRKVKRRPAISGPQAASRPNRP